MLTRVVAPAARVSLSVMHEVRGLEAALAWCALRRARQASTARRAELAAAVADVIATVARRGESALLDLTRRFDGVELASVVVPRARLEADAGELAPALREAIDLAMERVRTYYSAQAEGGFEIVDSGAKLGMTLRPVASVGCYVPGGTAPLFSSLIMTGVPARVAGVERVVVATPPRPGGGVPREIAYVALQLGAESVLSVGGAQAVAALAFGVGEVRAVDMVVGPGNDYVVEAKRQLFGTVGIDSLAGPTETLVLADDSADPRHVAADLVAQAEHVGAEPVLVTTSESLLSQAKRLAHEMAAALPTSGPALESLAERGTTVLVADVSEGVRVLNAFAPEHACLLVRGAEVVAKEVRNAGGIFVGHASMEALGDYLAGPSHVMPTGGTARFASFVNLRDFQKAIPYVAASRELLERVGPAAAALARAEGLEGHARAIEARLLEGPGRSENGG